ncbi:MAG: hypothetical protein ABGX16_12450 [Pirellulales bacterium]
MACSTLVFARGRSGNRRGTSGKPGSASRGTTGHGRNGHSGVVGNQDGKSSHGKHLSSKANSFTPQAHNFSSQAGRRKSALATNKQLQNLLQKRSSHSPTNLSKRSGHYQQHASQVTQQFQNSPQPFSPNWYAQHPNAWQYSHPHTDAAIVASTAAVAAWISGYRAPVNSGGSSTTVVYQETPAEGTATIPLSTDVAANVIESESVEIDSWLSLGIYSVSIAKGVPPTRMLQLAINHQGDLRGVFHDSLADTSQNIVGQLNLKTQVAQWSLESNKNLTFEAPLQQLTQPTGQLRANLPSGSELWNLAQVGHQEK